MQTTAFLAYLERQKQDVLEHCTACGKCVAVCPMPQYDTTLHQADTADIVAGVKTILRGGEAAPLARAWAMQCSNSGCCIPACPEGVNPRKMLALTRLELRQRDLQSKPEAAAQAARKNFRGLNEAIRLLLGIQLRPDEIAKLLPGSLNERQRPADVVFYFGCNVLRTPEIALNVLSILEQLEVDYEVLGGTANCCGITFMREGDAVTANAIASQTLQNMQMFQPKQVLSWCPSCNVHMQDFVPEAKEQEFPMRHVTAFLVERLPQLQQRFAPVYKRVALHEHHGVDGVAADVRQLLQAIPGLELVDIPQLADHGHQCAGFRHAAVAKDNVHRTVLDHAAAAGVDVLAGIYHSCHREMAAAEQDYPFVIQNFTSLLAEALGTAHDDLYKRLLIYRDMEKVLEETAPFIQANQIDTQLVQLALPKELWS